MYDVAPDDTSTDLSKLRRAALDEPRNGVLRYRLAAEMAHLQDYAGAVLEFSAAIALEPSLHVARLQLGLLHLTLAQPQQALEVLATLATLADDEPLKHFAHGLVALTQDDFDTCLQAMRLGVDLNTLNPALNHDMQLIIERVREIATAPAEPAGDATVRTDFSLYGFTRH